MKKKNLMNSLTALVLSVLMVLSLAACGAKPSDGGKDEDKDGYTVAIIKQMDHASLDEIADAIAARLDAIAQEQNVSIRYTITSGQGDQSVLKQLADQAVADQVDAIIPIATTAAQVSAVAAEDSRTPVVYAAISDPDTAKLTGIDYVTGTSDALNTEYILDMMLAQDPGVSKVGLLYSLSEPNSTKPIAEAKAYLEQHGITCVEQTANTNDEVVAAAAALISVIRALTVSPDSEFVAIAPYFPEYLPFVESNGGKLVSVPADLDTFQISLDILEAHLTSHTQAVLVNSPNNPTGCVYTKETLDAVHAILRDKPIFVLCDDVYRTLTYCEDYHSFAEYQDMRDRIIVVQSFSKPYAIYLEPANGVRWQKKVVVLTNRRSFSATNDFVNHMRCLPNVTTIGDKTGGGSGMPFTSELPNGWSVRFSASPHFDAEMNHIEFGIEPDIKADMLQEDELRGKDTLIEMARRFLSE